MSEIQDSWKNLAGRVEAFGRNFEDRVDVDSPPSPSAGPDADADANSEATTASDTSGTDDQPTAKSNDAKAVLEDLGHRLTDAFDSVGAAAKDQAVRDEVRGLGTALIEALGTTFSAVGAEIDSMLKKKSDREAESAEEPTNADDQVVEADIIEEPGDEQSNG